MNAPRPPTVTSSPLPQPEEAGAVSTGADLSRLCLSVRQADGTLPLAWTNSVCLLFLLIGVVGLKPPELRRLEITPAQDIVPVVIQQPEELPPEEPQPDTAEPPPLADVMDETPVVATVVAANSPAIAFAIPVKGPTILAPARFAEPPPSGADQRLAPRATRFNPGAGDRSTPQPDYPLLALKRGYQGTVVLTFSVEESGAVTNVSVSQTSGFTVLDEAALNTISRRWRFPPGARRHHYVEIVFQLK